MKLFYAAYTCSLASHIALKEAGAECSTVRISFADSERRSPGYLAIIPKGRVPALLTDRGILTETPAMLAFVAHTATCAQRCMWRTLTGCEVIDGPTIRWRLQRCSARCSGQ